MSAEQNVEQVNAVHARYADQLMRYPHVVGVGVGLAQEGGQYTSKISLVVMVDRKVPLDDLDPDSILPRELDGVRVDVQETGGFSAI